MESNNTTLGRQLEGDADDQADMFGPKDLKDKELR